MFLFGTVRNISTHNHTYTHELLSADLLFVQNVSQDNIAAWSFVNILIDTNQNIYNTRIAS
jgi:hypothetical protein